MFAKKGETYLTKKEIMTQEYEGRSDIWEDGLDKSLKRQENE